MNTPSHYITELRAITFNIKAREGESFERRAEYAVVAHHKVKRMKAEVDGAAGSAWEHVQQRIYVVNNAIYRELGMSAPMSSNIDRLIGRRSTPKENTMNFTITIVTLKEGARAQIWENNTIRWESKTYTATKKKAAQDRARDAANARLDKAVNDLFA